MIIRVTEDFEKYIESITPAGLNDVINFFQRIYSLMAERKLFVNSSYRFLCFLKNYFIDFSKEVRNLIEYLLNKYSTILSEINSVNPLVEIVGGENIFVELSGKYQCSIDKLFIDNPAVLMTENPADYDFYRQMFITLRRNYHKNLCLNDFSFGGGNCAIVERAITQNQIVLCICDSDRDYEGSKLGSTSRSVKKIIDKYKNKKICNLYVTEVREKENLLPYSFYKGIIPSADNLIDILALQVNENVQYFFDIKSGIKHKHLLQNESNQKWLEINLPIINEAKEKGIYNDSSPSSLNLNFNVISGIGNNAVSLLIQEKCDDFENVISQLKPKQLIDWNNITEKMLQFGFCFSSQIVLS